MLLFIDTETSGMFEFKRPATAKGQPHIVQLAAIVTDDAGEIMARLSTLIKPSGWTIEPGAQDVHGISIEQCEATGLPIAVVMDLVNRWSQQSSTVIAHNLNFDLAMVGAECSRCGVENCAKFCGRFCTMEAVTPILKLPGKFDNYKWPKLTETYRHFFGCEMDGAHDAMADVIGCMKCYFAITKTE
jgi:DNA polymerase-3 subunit epsilon